MVQFGIDEKNKCFTLTGDIFELLKKRRVKYYLLTTLKAQRVNQESLAISYANQNREILLRELQIALDKYRIEQEDSDEIKSVLENYYSEKEKFKLFSEKAGRIWSNDVEKEDFEQFKESLLENLPNRRLYDKQLLASFHLAFAQNACNFSVPGSGKTSVVYGAFAFLRSLPVDHLRHIDKLLIIGPLSSFGPWEDEYEECFGIKVTSKRLSGGVNKEERESYLNSLVDVKELADLTLMSYQSVSFNQENLMHFLSRKSVKYMIVLDEAHKIKNVDGGVWASSVLSLAKLPSINSRVVLTGTPVPNGYEDIYNLYLFIWPDKEIIDFNISQLKEISTNQFDPRIESLIESIAPFFIRIKKSDILDVQEYPVVNHEPLKVEMGSVQREIYDFIESKYLDYFERNSSSNTATSQFLKARFIRLMQAATNPSILKQPLETYYADQGIDNDLGIDDSDVLNKILNYTELEEVPEKFKAVGDLVQEILSKDEKVIIWGTFIKNIKDLQKYLKGKLINSELLIGEVPVENDELADDIITREKIIREFHNPNSIFKVIIANPFAVAESISLHKACHHAIYFERTFNAANFIQSKDRIHRVGLNIGTITNYHYVVSDRSIDETVHRRLNEKESRMLELIESKDIPLISENMNFDIDLENDIKAIIRDYVRRATISE